MKIQKGKASFGGCAIGVIHTPQQNKKVLDPSASKKQYQNVIEQLKQKLQEKQKEQSENEREQCIALQEVFKEEAFHSCVYEQIEQGLPAQMAVERAAGIYAGKLRSTGEEKKCLHACSVIDACCMISEQLQEPIKIETLEPEKPYLLAVNHFAIEDLLCAKKTNLVGIITSSIGVYSDACLLAEQWRLPVIFGVAESFFHVCEGKLAGIDGTTKEIFLQPDDAVLARLQHKIQQQKRIHSLDLSLHRAFLEVKGIVLFGDCIASEQVSLTIHQGAKGICLPRFWENSDSERENIQQIMNKTQEPVMMILSGRWQTSCFTNEQSFLQLAQMLSTQECQKICLVISREHIVERTQNLLDQLIQIKRNLKKKAYPFPKKITIGLMLDTPSSVLNMNEMQEEVDFFCVSPILLSQYANGMNRDIDYLDLLQECSAWKLSQMAYEQANNMKMPICGLCEGTTAPQQAKYLAEIGICELIVPAAQIQEVQQILCQM